MKNGIPNEVIKEIFPRKLKKAQFSHLVYTQLKKMILSGELRKAQRLTEEQVAHSLNVSRTPVRLALHQLEKEKLVIRKQRKGTFIA